MFLADKAWAVGGEGEQSVRTVGREPALSTAKSHTGWDSAISSCSRYRILYSDQSDLSALGSTSFSRLTSSSNKVFTEPTTAHPVDPPNEMYMATSYLEQVQGGNDFFQYPSHYPFGHPIYSYPNISTQCISDRDSEIHRRESIGSLGQHWQSTQSLTIPPQSFHGDPVPFYAPTPLSAPVPIPAYQVENSEYSPAPASQSSPSSLPESSPGSAGSVAEAPNGVIEKSSSMIPTFPTPSELLCEIKSSQGTASPESDSNQRGSPPRKVSVDLGQSSRDGISSHEKKRRLLECLEQYVIYLHEQLALLGAEPVSLERVDNYRGLGSRSIRTLLLHMENTNEELNHKVLAEEERFLRLREAYYYKQGAFPNLGNRSIAPYV